jgi:glutathione synthase/RimK-type ligase-like ATP-grasp enzyme
VKTIIISSSSFAGQIRDNYGFEVNQLIKVLKDYYDRYYLVYPPHVQHHFDDNGKKPKAFYRGEEISEATALIVRNTDGCEEASRMLAMNLYTNQCELLDPPERFHGAIATKSLMMLKGKKDRIIPPTYIVFNTDSAHQLIPFFENSKLYPMVGKPANGKQGVDVKLLISSRQTRKYIQYFYSKYQENHSGIIFQKYIEIKKEYRALILDGRCLGLVEKMPAKKGIARNAYQGSRFVLVQNETIKQYAVKYSNSKGLVGTDIAENEQNEFYLIETNRSPQWNAFENVTGINVAREIMEALEKRMLVSSELF